MPTTPSQGTISRTGDIRARQATTIGAKLIGGLSHSQPYPGYGLSLQNSPYASNRSLMVGWFQSIYPWYCSWGTHGATAPTTHTTATRAPAIAQVAAFT